MKEVRKRIVYTTVVVSLALLGTTAVVNRGGLLERYYVWQLESEDEDVRWQAAEKLHALGSPMAEDWYIARLSEEPEWEGRVRAAEALGEMRSVKAVRPILEMEHPQAQRIWSGPLQRSFAIHNIDDLLPDELPETEKLLSDAVEVIKHRVGRASSFVDADEKPRHPAGIPRFLVVTSS